MIKSNHGKEFYNVLFNTFCGAFGIQHEFSAPKTLKQNGVVECKKRTIQETTRVLLNAKELPKHWLAEAVNKTAIINSMYLRPHTTKTAYEIWKGKKLNLSHCHIFGSRCCILNGRDYLGKFQSKSDVEVFLGYLNNNRADRVFKTRTKVITESLILLLMMLILSDRYTRIMLKTQTNKAKIMP